MRKNTCIRWRGQFSKKDGIEIYGIYLSNTSARYKPGELYHTPEDALAAVDHHEKEWKLKNINFLLDYSKVK